MNELINALASLVKGIAQLTPLGVFALCIVLTFASATLLPSYTWIFIVFDVITGLIAVAWVWGKISD